MRTDEANEIRLVAANMINRLWAMRAVSQLELLKMQVDASLVDARGAEREEGNTIPHVEPEQ